ncbi:hypothetical protein ACQP2P_26705 [Dactylosporangium sp. CA-139114]|uniref:hypothetical protein n=1 Tax=Dactylosporangium sp. CA-139114 TaxID=3239931 RepID=UPI003D970DBD
MTAAREFFAASLQWEQRGGLFAARNDAGTAEYRAFRQAAEAGLFRRGVVRADVMLDPGVPAWTLVHLNVEPFGAMWCFVEQGRDGVFGPGGGCRASFVKLSRHHPVDVWRAGRDLAWTRSASRPVDLPLARDILAGVAAERDRIALPPSAGDNAALIEAVLGVLPWRVTSSWLWSTHLYGTADRYVAGRAPDDGGLPAPARPTPEIEAAFERLAAQLGGVTEDVDRLVRASRAEHLADFLAALPALPAQGPRPGPRPSPQAARTDRVAARASVPTARAVAPPGRPVSPAPAAATDPSADRPQRPRPAGPATRDATASESPSEVTQAIEPPGARTGSRSAVARNLVWVAWADTGNGFERLGDEAPHPGLRRFWAAAQSLLDSEKVPNGVDTTLRHPLWTLRAVPVEGLGDQWCFVERGRGNRVGADGQAEKERQFGMAGGCRFGFAPFEVPPAEVWRAGVAAAWTVVPEWDKGFRVFSDTIAQILAGIGDEQARLFVPRPPAENAQVIERVLTALPSAIAARWVWSTCLFRPADMFVAGGAPRDIYSADPIARLAAQVAAKSLPDSADRLLAGLRREQRRAFERLVQLAVDLKPGSAFEELRRRSKAADLAAFLDEMVASLPLEAPSPEDVPRVMATAEGRANLHAHAPGAVVEFAAEAPADARRYLSADPGSTVAQELVEGLLHRQRTHPAENVFEVPTGRQTTSFGRIAPDLVREYLPEKRDRVTLMLTMTGAGGVLHDPRNLAGAEPFVAALELPWEDHPNFYPARILREVAGAPNVSAEAEEGVLRSTDPEGLLTAAVTGMRRPLTAEAARWFMIVMDRATRADRGDGAELPRLARRVLESQKGDRTQWWAEVNLGFPFGQFNDVFRSRVLSAGVSALYELNGHRPLVSNALAELVEQVGLVGIEVPVLPEPPPRERRDWFAPLREWSQRRRQRRRAGAGMLRRRALVVVLMVVVIVVVVIGLAFNGPASRHLPAAPASASATPSPVGSPVAEPGSEASTSASPARPSPPAGVISSDSFQVRWETANNTNAAVDSIFAKINDLKLRPGKLAGIQLDCYADRELTAKSCLEQVSGALPKRHAELKGVPVTGDAHWDDREKFGYIDVVLSITK